jgi:hypothetical protein
MRPIGLAYIDSDLEEGQKIEIQYRGKSIHGLIVDKNLSSEAPPYAHPLFVLQKPVKRRGERRLKTCHGTDAQGSKHPLETERIFN